MGETQFLLYLVKAESVSYQVCRAEGHKKETVHHVNNSPITVFRNTINMSLHNLLIQ
jgi:hypothetical protein